MHYYIYEIKNNINGKIYIGAHRTENLEDGYMGSGRVLNRAKNKYGVENFTKTVLEIFDSSEAMFAREKEIVNAEFLNRSDVYNLLTGGHGGFDFIINSGKHSSVSNVGKRKSKQDIEKRSRTRKDLYANGSYDHMKEASRQRCLENNPMSSEEARNKSSEANKGVTKSEEHKLKISKSLTGKTGSKYPYRKKREPLIFLDVQCPHCQKVGKSNAMVRYHFDKCKFKLL